MAIRADLRQRFAPTGVLRASINIGNPVLAHLDAATRQPGGVSVDLARELAAQLGVGAELRVFDTAAQSVQAVSDEQADVGFFAVDPKRGETIAFTEPYVLIEGCYLVRDASPIRRNDEVDRPGVTLMVGKGSAYDLYLTREIKQATLLRAPTSPAVVSAFLEQGADVAAGVRQQLQADAQRIGGLRLLDQRFMVIRQAMGCPKSRGADAAAGLADFVEQMKASGFVAAALARHGVEGASVAPARSA
jgi:polar amino acid transport system substrate-binding protein